MHSISVGYRPKSYFIKNIFLLLHLDIVLESGYQKSNIEEDIFSAIVINKSESVHAYTKSVSSFIDLYLNTSSNWLQPFWLMKYLAR